ncbi:unnamed protein product [Cercospora beticola]|nr:unnamed protein product [Cercospora beticola]
MCDAISDLQKKNLQSYMYSAKVYQELSPRSCILPIAGHAPRSPRVEVWPNREPDTQNKKQAGCPLPHFTRQNSCGDCNQLPPALLRTYGSSSRHMLSTWLWK